jgi:hypothetical protein
MKEKEVLRRVRSELTELEETVPWNAVRRMWRSRRTLWRRTVKQADAVVSMAYCVQEFRVALYTDDNSFQGCGRAWRASIEQCMHGRGSHGVLWDVWEELKASILSWLGLRSTPTQLSSAQLQESAARARVALEEAMRRGADSLSQVPLEAILNGNREGLQMVRTELEQERMLVAVKLTVMAQQAGAWRDSCSKDAASFVHFDSGACTEEECGSDVTDLDSD